LMVLTFWSNERFHEKAHHAHDNPGHGHDNPGHGAQSAHEEHHGGKPHETSRVMATPLIVLAIGAALVGFLGMPAAFGTKNYFEHFLEPSIAHSTPHSETAAASSHMTTEATAQNLEASATPPTGHEETKATHENPSLEWGLMAASVVIAALGIFIGWGWFNKNPLWEPPKLLEDKYRVDEAYDAAIIQPIKQGSTNILWKIVDVKIIDGAVNGAGKLAAGFGNVLRYLQSGFARSYVAIVVLGALLIIGYFITRLR
jgi:NADH-quinone oxidoreductase subunit L